MVHNHSLSLPSCLAVCVSLLSIQLFSGREIARAAGDAESVYLQAQDTLAHGDTTAAMQLLDRAVEIGPDHGASRILRGRLYLYAGDVDKAKVDFSRAFYSQIPEIRARACAGLGHVDLHNPTKTDDAVDNFRDALKSDPTCWDAIYDPGCAQYLFAVLNERKVASDKLADIIKDDILHPNAYRIWRDMAVDKRDDQIHDVDDRLEEFLESHPDSAAWWVDLARDRFYFGKTDKALETLDQMAQANPDYVSPDIPLLRARCALESRDTSAFYDYYQQALQSAQATGEYTRLFRQAEPLLYHGAYYSWEACHDNDSRADFFRQFWGALKPDPLSPVNPRIATHYSRLFLAEKDHHLQLPNIPYGHSRAMSFPKDVQQLFTYGKKDQRKRGQEYQFDPLSANSTVNGYSGLLDAFEPTKRIQRLVNPLKFWFIGYSGYLNDFSKKAPGLLSNTMVAIQKQYDVDTEILHSGILTYARYRSATPGNIEIEFYQGGIPGHQPELQAEMAVFDLNWQELERRQGEVYRAADYPAENMWQAVYRMDIQPGTYWFGVRMQAASGVRWVERGLMDLHSFSDRKLDLSGVVLGTLPPDDSDSYNRHEIDMLPRPSLKFKRGEIISVYLEVYNLKKDQDGERDYTEEVDVTLVKDNAEKTMDFAGGTVTARKLDPDKSTTSLNHRFERSPGAGTGPVPEFFTVDTSQLRPGNYRMTIKITENSNKIHNQSSCIFELGD